MFTWEILGRTSHLLADVSTPAHALYDQHDITSGEDYYENMMGNLYSNFTYQDAITQAQQWGTINITSISNPIKYLFFTSAQIAGHFPSRDVNGNNSAGINDPFDLYPPLQNVITLLGVPPPRPDEYDIVAWTNLVPQIANASFVYSIRATAGLLEWFANEVGIIPPPPPPLGVTINGETHPSSYTTSPFTSTVTGAQGGVTYQWEQMLQCCTDDNNCGVYFYRGSNSTLNIYNTTVHYYLRLTVWDGAGRSAVDHHYVTLETCVPGGGGNGCPTLSLEPDSTSDSGGEDENPLLISSTTYPTEDVVDYYLIQSELTSINDEIHINIHEPASEHTWLDQVQLIEIETSQDEQVAVTDNGEIVNYRESDSDLTIVINDTIDVTAVLESSDDNTLSVVPGDILSIEIDPNGSELASYVVAIDGFVSQKAIAADVLFVFPGGGDEDVGDFFLRPNPSMSALSFGGLGAGTLKLVFHQDGTLDFLSLLNDLNTADIETLEMTAAVHSESGNVIGLVDGEPDQHYAEIYPDQNVSFIFNEGKHSLSNIRYVLKTVGRYETDTTFAFNKLAMTGDEEIIPRENKLFDNYPNPFNPTTQIKYSINENGLVTLKVYDILGKEVAELVNEEKQAGTYTVSFDASNLASGIYIYSINANNFHQTKKMLLLK